MGFNKGVWFRLKTDWHNANSYFRAINDTLKMSILGKKVLIFCYLKKKDKNCFVSYIFAGQLSKKYYIPTFKTVIS
jgi:hypothetical protein